DVQTARGAPRREGRQPGQEPGAVGGDDGALVEQGAGGSEGTADDGGGEVGGAGGVFVQSLRLGAQCLGCSCGQRPDGGPGAGGRRYGRRRWGWWLFEDEMRVGAADAEGGDARAADPFPGRPGLLVPEQGERAGTPVDVRARPVRVQG